VFGQLINTSAGLMMVSLYLRHRHIMAFFKVTRKQRWKLVWSSRIFMCVGIIAAYGLSLVANFQERTVTVIHFMGAFTAFVFGLAYGWYQTTLSFLSPRQLTPRWLAIVRLIICIFGTIFFLGFFARNIDKQHDPLEKEYLEKKYNGTSLPPSFYRGPGDPGYTSFLVTTISEWCLAICLALFFLTLAFDLYGHVIHPPKLHLKIIDAHVYLQSEQPDAKPCSPVPEPVQCQIDPVIDDDHTDYAQKIDYVRTGIPLPGMTSDRPNRWDNGNFQSGAKSDIDSPVESNGDTRSRGLRRSYDNVITVHSESSDRTGK